MWLEVTIYMVKHRYTGSSRSSAAQGSHEFFKNVHDPSQQLPDFVLCGFTY